MDCKIPSECTPLQTSGTLDGNDCAGECREEDDFCDIEDANRGFSFWRANDENPNSPDFTCKFCLCTNGDAPICQEFYEFVKGDLDFQAAFATICSHEEYPDLANEELGAAVPATQCKFADVVPKCTEDITECGCNALICKTKANYAAQMKCIGDEPTNTSGTTQNGIIFGIGFVITMCLLWME